MGSSKLNAKVSPVLLALDETGVARWNRSRVPAGTAPGELWARALGIAPHSIVARATTAQAGRMLRRASGESMTD